MLDYNLFLVNELLNGNHLKDEYHKPVYNLQRTLNSIIMPKNIIIVGMPRSGTSMTASIFAKNGYFVTNDEDTELRTGDEHNPLGYWEAKSLIKSNSEIFKAAGFNHDNTWLYDAITSLEANKIHSLKHSNEHKALVEKFNKTPPWVWKDPRLCYTLSYWWPLIDPSSTKVLLLTRNPKEIYQSFIRLKWRPNNKTSRNDVYARTQAHIQNAIKTVETYNIPHITIDYSDFDSKPEETARQISDFFDIDINANDIPFSKNLNRSTLLGRFSTLIDHFIELLPSSFRKAIKALTPSFIFKIIFPYRKK